jgi:hypothetical protein
MDGDEGTIGEKDALPQAIGVVGVAGADGNATYGGGGGGGGTAPALTTTSGAGTVLTSWTAMEYGGAGLDT